MKKKETIKENQAGTPNNLLDDIDTIAKLGLKHKLSELFFERAKPHLAAVGSFFRITETQAALFSLIMELSDDGAIPIGKIAKTLKLRKIQMFKYMDDFDVLETKMLVKVVSDTDPFSLDIGVSSSNPCYTVPFEVIKALRKGRLYKKQSYKNLEASEFFEIADRLFTAAQKREISGNGFTAEMDSLFNGNIKSAFVQGVLKYKLSSNNARLLLFMICAWLTLDDGSFTLSILRTLLGYQNALRLVRKFKNGEHPLLEVGLIENVNDDGLADAEAWVITSKTKEIFMADLNIKEIKKKKRQNVIAAEELQERSLFYSENVTSRINELTSLLTEENFSTIKMRLIEKKMPAAFTILFQGSPGTGKTETVYQIARKTGRDICQVDISETKSQWFGESEKRIKGLFDSYRGLLRRKNALTPILLFNEADAVLGKRQELGETRRGPAQTENAIQNIILEEMEKLHDGILIATTNMICNLDKAFERRFLYKIEFENPTEETRAAIWQNMMPALDEAGAMMLSRRFEFSGGQINNIAKKEAISSILRCRELDLEDIIAFCNDEQIEKKPVKIGFGV
jgi:hypothetical protein